MDGPLMAVVLWDSLLRFRFDSGILLVGYTGAQLSKTGNSNTGSEGAVRPNVGRQVYNVDVWRVNGMSSGCAGQAWWQLLGTSQLQYAGRRLRLIDSTVSAWLQIILGDQLRMCSRYSSIVVVVVVVVVVLVVVVVNDDVVV